MRRSVIARRVGVSYSVAVGVFRNVWLVGGGEDEKKGDMTYARSSRSLLRR